MNYKLDTNCGNTIDSVAKKAKEIAKEKDVIVGFDFNGIICLVAKDTVVDWLVRDYMNAHIMNWKQVGPDCKMMYDSDTEIELYTRKLNNAKERKAAAEAQRIEDDAEKLQVGKLIENVELEIIPGKEDEYKYYAETNSKDGYSRGVVDYAEAWAKLMQVEISKGRAVAEVAEETQKPLGYIGITGFMYGCVVNTLSHFWKHGEELRKWHNKEYNHEGEGVVNPAVFTLAAKR